MLKADSSTLKSDSELQARKMPPMIPSSVEWFWIRVTVLTISSMDTLGNALDSSRTTKLCSFGRPEMPSSDSARKVSGTNERSAKYAIIAARCVPRSAKNFENGPFTRTEYGVA